jgi:tannase/feruloyl esterase
MKRPVVLALECLALMFVGAASAQSSDPAAAACASLSQVDFEGIRDAPTRITSARLTEVASGEFENPFWMSSTPAGSSRIKQYCRVTGYVAPQNKFELRLPLPPDWNGNFYFAACGGMCGVTNGAACNGGLARGYASITGNGGHDGIFGFDGIWAAGAPNLQEDFAWRSNHVVTLAGKAITTRYYGRPIQHSYMVGCSKGGQAVLMEAQRFPEDFDAVMPIAPVYDLTGRGVIAAAWFTQAFSDGKGGSVLNQASADAVHKSVLATCGAQAGVDLGLVTEPGRCAWKPEMIACKTAAGSPDCLMPVQVKAIQRLMTPVTNSKGQLLYAYPYIPGTETEWARWNFSNPRPGEAASPTLNYLVVQQFLRYLADAQPRADVDPLKFNFDRDPATLARARKIYDATSYDLTAFKARGGKMLMWHGLADGGIIATSSIGYYEGVMKAMGGRAKTEDFFRLFLMPGVHHCAGGPGLTDFDALTALENWVEKGQPPTVLMARRSPKATQEQALPIYPYPVVARYAGSGDPKQASSFVPFDPTKK